MLRHQHVSTAASRSVLRRILIIASGGAVGAAMLALVSIRAGAIFGVGADLDAYFVAVSLPSLLLSLSSTVVVAFLVPRLSILEPSAARNRAGEWALLAFLLFACLAGVIVLASPLVIALLAPGLSIHAAALAITVLRIMAATLPSTMAAFVYSAYGYAFDRVWAGGISTALYGTVWLALLFLHPFTVNVQGIAVACLLATQLQLVVAFLLCATPTRLPWPRWRFPAGIGPAILSVAGILVATAVSKINLLMDPLFGSFLSHGSVSELSYASRIAILVISFTGQGSALTILASHASNANRSPHYPLLGVSVTMLLSIGAAVAIALAFTPVATLVLAHGALTSAKAATIGTLVQAYSLLIVVQAVSWSTEAAIYAEKRIWSVTLVSVPALVTNVALSALFVWLLGAYGRPLAVTLAMTLYAGLLMRIANRDTPKPLRSYLAALPWFDAAKLAALVSVLCGGCLAGGYAIKADATLSASIALVTSTLATLAYVRTWTRTAERRLAYAETRGNPLAAAPSAAT